jgi:hypothetical protein
MDYAVSIFSLFRFVFLIFYVDKSLNANCTNSSECWSGECRNNICQCPLGFISRNDDKRCRMFIFSLIN